MPNVEVKAEVKVERSEGTTEATSLLKDKKDTMLITHGTGRTSILTHWEDTETERMKEKRISFELNRKLPVETSVHKTKSLSSQFIVNVEELMNNVTGSYDETGTILSRASSNEMGSFLLSGSPLLSENISDVKLIHQNDSKNGQYCEPVDEDPDVCSWRKMHLEPTLPIYLKFEDVRYSATKNSEKQSDGEKCILHGVTGSVGPGEVLALMGPSGGGKTTLLNLLSGRVKSRGGSVTYNDQPFNKSLKQRIGYVLQDDITFPHLTVKETLTYSALLRLPNTLTADQKKERVANIIGDLDLERCQDTLIGGALVRGISGGERKRVCIGSEVLLNPSLLFLDEPTSGLDSTTALKIVQMLHNLAEAGKTVVATIHQPSSRLFATFDKLILLGKGSFLYSGKASEAMPYFSSIGCSPCIAMNPAEFLIDIANGNMKDKSLPSELEDKFLSGSQALESRRSSAGDVHEYLIEAYESRVASFKPTKLAKPMLIEGHSEIQGGSYSRDLGATWLEQFSILFQRGLKERRHEYLSSIRIIQVVSTAIIVGLLWWHSDASSPKRVHEQAGLLFFISVFWAFFPLFTAIFTFPHERAMLAKERSVGMYKLSAYVVARNSSDIPLDLILPVVFLAIVYFMVGLKPSFRAFSFTLLTIFLSVVASQGLGQAIGAAFMDVRKATTLASITVMTFMLSGGFFIQNVPSFMSWVRYISLNYHTYRLLLRIQYSCSNSGPESGICKYPFIKRQGLDRGGAELGAMLMMIIGYRVLAYLFLRRMKLRAIT